MQYANMTSFWEKISIIPIVYKRELDFVRMKWQDASAAILVYLLLRNLIKFSKAIFHFIRKMCSNKTKQSMISLPEIKEAIQWNNLKRQFLLNFTKKFTQKKIVIFLVWIGFNILGVSLLMAKGLAYSINYQFIEEFDFYTGSMGQWTKLCVVIAFNTILDWVIGKFINHKEVNTFVSMETILKETRILLYLPLGYVAIVHMDIIFGFAHRHTMNFVAGGLLLYTLLE